MPISALVNACNAVLNHCGLGTQSESVNATKSPRARREAVIAAVRGPLVGGEAHVAHRPRRTREELRHHRLRLVGRRVVDHDEIGIGERLRLEPRSVSPRYRA